MFTNEKVTDNVAHCVLSPVSYKYSALFSNENNESTSSNESSNLLSGFSKNRSLEGHSLNITQNPIERNQRWNQNVFCEIMIRTEMRQNGEKMKWNKTDRPFWKRTLISTSNLRKFWEHWRVEWKWKWRIWHRIDYIV